MNKERTENKKICVCESNVHYRNKLNFFLFWYFTINNMSDPFIDVSEHLTNKSINISLLLFYNISYFYIVRKKNHIFIYCRITFFTLNNSIKFLLQPKN